MSNATTCGKINVKDGWVICPRCEKGKILKVRPDSAVKHLDCKCKLCGKISEVNIPAPEPASDETSA